MGQLSSLVHLSLIASGIENGFKYQSLFVNDSWLVIHNSPSPLAFNSCACSVYPECATAYVGFECILGNNCTAGTTVWTVPGLILACTHYESMFSSDLRCFYDQVCFNTILSNYNVDMPDRLPLPASTLNIPVLNKSAPSRFSTTDSLDALFQQLAVEEWEIKGDFNGYYQACAPASCTYTSVQRLNIIDLVTTVVGLIGGLFVSLRLLARFAIEIIIVAKPCWQNPRDDIEHRERNRSTSMITLLK
ncbi:unnamed protein product [Rotaria sp. Silwood2]|nr:unnamed protein product [Rotaria sp. Silwood2]CAF4160695.1 unnamed protein product [Rotaria sp. Silwood2]CAF4272673.1 unnamed protein product [Rotaria sp. Silwood2]